MGVYDAYLKASDRTRVRRRELATAAADRCWQRTVVYPALARARHDALRAMSSAERAAATRIASARATAVERAHGIVARPRVVVDADMSFDDAATLAYLA